jgi:tetratricopeptide (TPR) repeat protein
MPRSRRELTVRWGLAALGAVLGYFGVTFSLAQSTMSRNPALAHQLAPYDGRITARLAASLIEGETRDTDRGDQLARRALRQDPTAVIAVSTLGINAEARGDTKAARRFFAYAFALSRRESRAQLWGIEDAAARGDVSGALRHYDIALRTRPVLADLLYPILASASTDPGIRRALAQTLAAQPRWGEAYINYVASNGSDPTSAAQLFVDLERARVAVPAAAQANVVNALVAGGQLDEAWRYYAAIRRGADRERSRDPRFAAGLESPSLLDWTPVNTGGVVTSTLDGAFDFTVPASVGGQLLQQVQLLPPGTYRIVGRSSGIEDQEKSRPYWVLRCRGDGRELGRVVLPNSAQANGRFTGTFSVPAGCPAQTLLLMARPTDMMAGLTGRLDHAALVPAP